MVESPVEQLARASQACGQLVAAVRPDQWDAATPCADWRVRDLVQHVIAGNDIFAAALSGAPATWPGGGPADVDQGSSGTDAARPAGDTADRYRESERALLAAFSAPGALEGMITIPFGTVPAAVALHLRTIEALVHGWDLARATGSPGALPEDLAEQELGFSRGLLAQVPPGRSPFAPPQPVPDDASAIDRLAALLGRAVRGGPDRAPTQG